MIDVVDGGRDYRFRIAGDRVVQFMGRRYAGLLLSEFLDQPFFQRMRAILEQSVKHKRPLAAGPMRSNMEGKEFLELEVVVLAFVRGRAACHDDFRCQWKSARPQGSPRLPEGQPKRVACVTVRSSFRCAPFEGEDHGSRWQIRDRC